MIATISFSQAWTGYRRWAHRLPTIQNRPEPERVSGLIEILDDFDVVILDNFGVLSLGAPAITKGPRALSEIRRRRLILRVITNDGAKSIDAMCADHASRGYTINTKEIFPGFCLLSRTLAQIDIDRPWGVIGLQPYPEPKVTSNMITLTNEGLGNLDLVGGLVFLDARPWRPQDQQALISAFKYEHRPVIVCNPDLAAPYPNNLSIEPGWFANHLADETDVEPIFLGKPFPEIYDEALAGLEHIPRERIIAVGDTLHTDILGAHTAGIKSLLVETGFTRSVDPLMLMAESGLYPNYVAKTI